MNGGQEAQTELDGGIGEHPLASPAITGQRVPPHVFVQPAGQRSSGFERSVVRCPVGGLVAGLAVLGFTHTLRLSVKRPGFVAQSRLELYCLPSEGVLKRTTSKAGLVSW